MQKTENLKNRLVLIISQPCTKGPKGFYTLILGCVHLFHEHYANFRRFYALFLCFSCAIFYASCMSCMWRWSLPEKKPSHSSCNYLPPSVLLGWLCKCTTWNQCSTQKTQQQDLEIWTRCNQHRRCSQTECYRSDSYFSVRDLTSAGGGGGHLTHGQTRGLFRKQRKALAYWRTFHRVAMPCRPGSLNLIPFLSPHWCWTSNNKA